MSGQVFPVRRALPADLCGHCEQVVNRVWLVPGDVLDSCAACFEGATGRAPVHEQGHSSADGRRDRPPASFYLRVDGRRPA